MKENMNIPTNIKSVEANRVSDLWCKKLFPQWCLPPFHGELLKIIRFGWEVKADENSIKIAGSWWLWMRNKFIENTITKEAKTNMMKAAITATVTERPINLVTTRSPEFVHSQVEGQGDSSLPRSHKALLKLEELVASSAESIPTVSTIILADLAIDNLDRIIQVCNLEETIKENLKLLDRMAQKMDLGRFRIMRMSELKHPLGKLGNLVSNSGEPLVSVSVPFRSLRLVEVATKESQESHQKMFGWTAEQSFAHNQRIAITMGMVGQSIKTMDSQAILIHNESFISRGQLNNLFNDPKDPLPVICLTDLLETKAVKR